VSIFLTEPSSRHSVLTKQKVFKDKGRIQSNSGKLTNWLTTGTSDQPVFINEDAPDPIVIMEEEDANSINIADIPEGDELDEPSRRSTRQKRQLNDPEDSLVSDGGESDTSALFVPGRPSKRSKTSEGSAGRDEDENAEGAQDDKKKLGLNTSYDGFSIYGRILCLVVRRRGARSAGGSEGPASSQQMLEYQHKPQQNKRTMKILAEYDFMDASKIYRVPLGVLLFLPCRTTVPHVDALCVPLSRAAVAAVK
jgi:hypothetical protein